VREKVGAKRLKDTHPLLHKTQDASGAQKQHALCDPKRSDGFKLSRTVTAVKRKLRIYSQQEAWQINQGAGSKAKREVDTPMICRTSRLAYGSS